MDAKTLKACMPTASTTNVALFAAPLTAAMAAYEINTPKRQAAFLAQVAHESACLRYTEELASGDAYDTRTDLGNTPQVDGDGRRYKGRGLLQVTGLANYHEVSKALQYDFVAKPEKLALPGAASLSAAWFWHSRGLNELADADDFLKISIRINGRNKKTGLPNGWEDRQAHWERIKGVLGTI